MGITQPSKKLPAAAERASGASAGAVRFTTAGAAGSGVSSCSRRRGRAVSGAGSTTAAERAVAWRASDRAALGGFLWAAPFPEALRSVFCR